MKGIHPTGVGHYRTIWCEVISVEFLQNSKWYFYAVPKSCCPETISCFGSSFRSMVHLLFGIWWPVDTMAMANTLTTKWSFFWLKICRSLMFDVCLVFDDEDNGCQLVGGWGEKWEAEQMLTQALTLTLHLKWPNQHILCPWTSWKFGYFVRARKCCSYLQYELHLLLRARLAEDILDILEIWIFWDRQTFLLVALN